MSDNINRRAEFREKVTRQIIAELEYEIETELFWAPDALTEDDRKGIREEVLAQARVVTDSLSTAELRNDGARQAYNCRALETVRHLINLRMAQLKRT